MEYNWETRKSCVPTKTIRRHCKLLWLLRTFEGLRNADAVIDTYWKLLSYAGVLRKWGLKVNQAYYWMTSEARNNEIALILHLSNTSSFTRRSPLSWDHFWGKKEGHRRYSVRPPLLKLAVLASDHLSPAFMKVFGVCCYQFQKKTISYLRRQSYHLAAFCCLSRK